MPASVRLTVRIPAAVAYEVQALAQQHQLPIAAVVRWGLESVLTHPPPVAPAAHVPATLAPPRPTITDWVVRTLAMFPEGQAVDALVSLMRAGNAKRWRETFGRGYMKRQDLGSLLRSLYRAGRIQRVGHGIYAPLA
jgi:hypothetical protein